MTNIEILQFVSITLYLIVLIFWDYITSKDWWKDLPSEKNTFSEKGKYIVIYHWLRPIFSIMFIVSSLFIFDSFSIIYKLIVILYAVVAGRDLGVFLSDLIYLRDEDYKSLEEAETEVTIGQYKFTFRK